jgi:hypothetical protein
MSAEEMRTLRERVGDAEIVVSGTVTGTESVDRPLAGAISHHEPMWVAVKIRVESVVKGEVQGDSVVAEIARSADPRVDSGLRPEVGQAGLWILHRTADGRLTMDSPVDYQPLEAAHRFRGLVDE